jgi:hypothetical protein
VFQKVASFLVLAGCLFTSVVAGAAPRDKAAQKKIEEAIYTHFLNTDFDAAEGLLLGTIRACEDKCSPEMVGKAWMYVGVVRGSGRNDIAGATEAFTTAIATNPNVVLDLEIATDPVKAAFAGVKPGAGPPPPAAGPGEGSGGAFTCASLPTEIETRRPVPMECESDKPMASAKLFYKSFNGGWSFVKMEQHEKMWRGTIPCSVTQSTGKLRYYAQGFDANSKIVASLGDKNKPNTADVVAETTAAPPAFPAEEPPARCGVDENPAAVSAPGEGGACMAYGVSCKGGGTCCEGMACIDGTCGEAECQSDSDCKNGAECALGKCESGDEKGGNPKYSKNLIGLSFAFDIASISSDKACAQGSRQDFITCFDSRGTYEGTPVDAGGAGKITGGLAPATLRILASYERLFGPFGAEARLGFAFNGGETPKGGAAFLPVHAEVRGKYWILGEKAFAKPGFRPWVHVGGGLAQVDVTVNVPVADCQDASKRAACQTATSVGEARQQGAQAITLAATKHLGKNFVTAGGGVMYAVAKNHGAILNLNLMVPFPSTGVVLEPSLGYVYGF